MGDNWHCTYFKRFYIISENVETVTTSAWYWLIVYVVPQKKFKL